MKAEDINGCANEFTREGFTEARYESLGRPINGQARVREPCDTRTDVDDLSARAPFQDRDQFMGEVDNCRDIEGYRFLDIAQVLFFESPKIASHSCIVDEDIGFFLLFYDPMDEVLATLRF